jgi:hypothetical protein
VHKSTAFLLNIQKKQRKTDEIEQIKAFLEGFVAQMSLFY